MSTSRDNIMGRVRKALGKPGRDEAALAAAEAYIASHAQGPRLAWQARDPTRSSGGAGGWSRRDQACPP